MCNFYTFLKITRCFLLYSYTISEWLICIMYMLGGAHASQDNDESRCDVQVHIKEHAICCHGFTKSNRRNRICWAWWGITGRIPDWHSHWTDSPPSDPPRSPGPGPCGMCFIVMLIWYVLAIYWEKNTLQSLVTKCVCACVYCLSFVPSFISLSFFFSKFYQLACVELLGMDGTSTNTICSPRHCNYCLKSNTMLIPAQVWTVTVLNAIIL